jgi:hypothetical protein
MPLGFTAAARQRRSYGRYYESLASHGYTTQACGDVCIVLSSSRGVLGSAVRGLMRYGTR